ncbi:MAG: FG-GAP repeat domain-containing protein, partial [Bradymonadaceae bacterium]
MTSTRWILIIFLALSLSAGCGGCDTDSGMVGGGDEDAGNVADTPTQPDEDTCVGASCPSVPDTANGGDEDTGPDTPPVPQCPSAQTCGSACCETQELCIQNLCVIPGAECTHNLQCPPGQMCEPSLERCLPLPAEECTFQPEGDVFDPVVHVAWRDDENTPLPAYNQVMMTPSVVDITENGTPDIVFTTFTGSGYNAASVLRAVDGRTFESVFDLIEPDKFVNGGTSLAIGDLDGDGRMEIVAVMAGGGLMAFDDHTTGWEVMWRTEEIFGLNADGPALADLNADGNVEVVAANRVFSAVTGKQLCINTEVGGGAYNSIAIDLSGDGNLEVLAAGGAFHFRQNVDGDYECPTFWVYEDGRSGFPAVGDFGTFTDGERNFGDRDGVPEVVRVDLSAVDQIQLINGQTGRRIWARTLPVDDHPHFTVEQCVAKTGAGPPTVADFNGDGVANIATAGACYYVVYDADGDLLWKMPGQDFSSRVTGSSVFDFEGDGRAEVVYADECFLRVYDGQGNGDGTSNILFEVANTTGTLRELPVIVDVDGDFHADIVLIGNDYSGVTTRCRENWENFDELGGPSRGIRVIKDRENRWVSTGPVWNQHAYSVTNVCDGINDQLCPGVQNIAGAIPRGQINNWQVGYLNNFRQN